MAQVDRLTAEMTANREQIDRISRRQPACRALKSAHYGIGPLTSVATCAEMGDTPRFHSSDDAVRHGLTRHARLGLAATTMPFREIKPSRLVGRSVELGEASGLVALMLLAHEQRQPHQPVALILSRVWEEFRYRK